MNKFYSDPHLSVHMYGIIMLVFIKYGKKFINNVSLIFSHFGKKKKVWNFKKLKLIAEDVYLINIF